MTETTAQATAHAERIKEALAAGINDSKMRLRVWAPEGQGIARVYTGFGSRDYVEVTSAGHVSLSHDRMAWSHKIEELLGL
jgi:hypothetical protein